MSNFYKRLNYSIGNEDWKTERAALQLRPTDEIVCITASGDRPLNLLLNDCKKITCIDANPIQTNLFYLKIAAIKAFDYKQFSIFLGLLPCRNRSQMLYSLKDFMPNDSFLFWTKNKRMIDKGIIFQGKVERLSLLASKFIKLFKKEKVKKLFSMTTIEEQREFIEKEWEGKLWKRIFNFCLHPTISFLFINDPGLYQNDWGMPHGEYIYRRMKNSMIQTLVRENYFLSLILNGAIEERAYPPYLQEKNFDILKKNVTKVEVKTENIITFLESSKEASFDGFSISDVSSYLDKEGFEKLIKAIYKTAKPNAKFCLRQFMTKKEIFYPYCEYFHRDEILEKKLETEDLCFVYNFMAGFIIKS